MTTEFFTISTYSIHDVKDYIARRLNEIYSKIDDVNQNTLSINFERHATRLGNSIKGRTEFCDFVRQMNDEFWEEEFGKRLVLEGDKFVWKTPNK